MKKTAENFDYKNLTTEGNNPNSIHIDQVDTAEILRIINTEDLLVAAAVQTQIPQIAQAVELICSGLSQGGHLIYIGAGTSGRLGVLDASECPPTFGCSPDLVQAYIAGGDKALRYAIEGAEDDMEAGAAQIRSLNLAKADVVVGITASGAAAFVIGALQEANALGAKTIGIVTNDNTLLSTVAQLTIAPVVGPEVIAGSTRMKSGTAQKLVLNMLTTAAMIKQGKVYQNWMVDLHASNQKLTRRSLGMIMAITGTTEDRARRCLEQTGGHVKLAVLLVETGLSVSDAQALLDACGGHLGEALKRGKDAKTP